MRFGGEAHRRVWSRRRFLRAAILAALGGAVTSCAPLSERTPDPATPKATDPLALTNATRSVERILRNENQPDVKPDWNVRYFRPYRPVDRDHWRLNVDGLVESPRSLSLEAVSHLPRVDFGVRMTCVEGWSAEAAWGGFTYTALAELVQPSSDATWLTFECADGYYESLSIEELSQPQVLFAYDMDGEPLFAEFGAPLRMVVPSKYGYKWPKAITHLRFESRPTVGYWPSAGPYSAHGDIGRREDSPLGQGDSRETDSGVTAY